MMKKILPLLSLLFLFLVLIIAFPQHASARFGGSQGGGTSSGSSSFNSSGSGSSTNYRNSSGTYYASSPNNGIVSLIFAVPALLIIGRIARQTIKNSAPKRKRVSKETDVLFRKRFYDFQTAWSNNDLTPIQAYMTRSFYKQNNALIEEYQQNNTINKLENIKIHKLELLHEIPDQTIRIRVTAAMKDYFISTLADDATKEKQKRDAKMESFSEVWVLMKIEGTWVVADIVEEG